MTRVCVIGWPISHSRSPLIHGYWLKHYGLTGSYTRQPVASENLETFIQSLAANGYAGCNVTIPHKEAAYHLVTAGDELTARLGVVNTIYLEGSRLMGISTDGPGFLSNLRESQPRLHLPATPALILGAGGAAQAIAGALLEAGCPSLTVANRNHDRALAMAAKFGPRLRAVPWSEAEAAMEGVGLLVNTTALGMTGQPPLVVNLARLPTQAIVSDIVYTPLETDLLQQARLRGLATVEGLGMLLHQAAPGFQKWFGRYPEVTPALRNLLEADIAKATSA